MGIEKAPLSFEKWKQCGKYFEWKDHNVFFQRGGKGQVLLMIHGFPTCGWDWCWISRHLLDRFHMVLPDLLDYGLSLNANRRACSIKEQADMIEALMKHRGIKEAHILAHDVGDTVAQELLARHNESQLSFRILSTIFLNGGIIPDLHRPRPVQKLLAGPLGGLISRIGNKTKFLKGFADVFGIHTRPEGEALAEFWPAMVGVNGRGAFARRIRYMTERKQNAARWISAIKDAYMPLMMINGVDDPVSGGHAADGWSKLVPKAKLARLPGIGHYPQVEAPDTVVELINQFHDCIVEKSDTKQSA
jgi:pimeloyl-ACP methyl ester carboxylesterase